VDELKVRSTSKVSAQTSDVVLRETTTTRLIFRPMLVDNAKRPEASVKGTFVFQRKSPKSAWEDVPSLPLSSLKRDEGYHLALDSAETLSLFATLAELYQLFKKEGIPIGETEFVRARGALTSLAELPEDRLQVFLAANEAAGAGFIARLLTWAISAKGVPELIELLERLGSQALANLTSALSVSFLAEVIAFWKRERANPSEQFWQDALGHRSFLLEHLFAWPCSIIAGKAYVGGKSIQNVGGNLVDFLVRNDLTRAAALVEIKTPSTKLTGRDYREGIPNISSDLAGGVLQVLAYKASLTETYQALRVNSNEFDVFDPPCTLIIGDTTELQSVKQRRTFELFRRQLVGVTVIAFDEVFGRAESLVALLRKGLIEQVDRKP
jgi:Domain of unknown function (DUF4263)